MKTTRHSDIRHSSLLESSMRWKALLLLTLITPLLLSSCWKSKQQFYTTVTNHSSLTLRSIEVDYPGGGYGITELAPGQSNQKWIFANGPCTYSIRFVDEHGKQYAPKPLEFSKEPCPTGIALNVDGAMNVTIAAAAK